MANTDKNILITPNYNSSTDDPKIVFQGANASVGAQTITLRAYPDSNGTLSFEGSAGQLFSITNDLTGTIFSVNDVSGIPSIEVTAAGLVKIAEFSGNTLFGTGTDNGTDKIQVNGSIIATVIKSNVALGTAPFVVTSTTQVANLSVATAGSATTAGTVTTAAQPNITSVGTLTSLTVTNAVTAGSIVKSGGTSAQFLKADGTIDSSAYITSASVGNGTLTLAVSGTGLSGSASFTANQSGAASFTVTSNATNANTASTIVARDASGNFSAGTITATLSGTATTGTNWGAYGAVPAAGTSFGTANTIGRSDANGYTYFGYINSSTGNSENPTVSQVIVTNGSDNFYRKASIAHVTSSVQSNASGNWSINATNLSTNRTNWSTNGTISAVVGQLCWKNYGNSHTIFDASNSTSPDGTAKNNTNPDVAWTGTYPTLMGWNGTNTYGVRVDSARYSDQSKYADLAEKYLADKEYPVGTVLMIGGTAEVTLAEKDSRAIVGVISENGFVMNADLKGENIVAIGYIGRVPCRVKGKINRGDFLVVGDIPGVAVATNDISDLTGKLIGKALANHEDDNEGVIEILVGRL